MRLRWTLAFAFVLVSLLQLAVVSPFALRNLSVLFETQQEARVDQLMVTAVAEMQRLEDDVSRAMNELQGSPALEDAARDAMATSPPENVTTLAAALMTPRGLDVLSILDSAGRTLSSGHLPARLGEPEDPLWVATQHGSEVLGTRVELSTERGLATAPVLVTARTVDGAEGRAWAVGGFLLSEARAINLARLTGARVDIIVDGQIFASAGRATAPTLTRTIPVGGIATVQLTFPLGDLVAARQEVRSAFFGFASVGFLLSILLGFVVSQRITRPVELLTGAAKRIAEGSPGATVDVGRASGELKNLIETFNAMTHDLKEATDKLVSSERIAAWQEVARRLAHEIKNPLTPIRMSLETLVAASQRGPLDEKFRNLFAISSRAVLEEVDRLTRIVDEFSRFARLPQPRTSPVDLADVVAAVMALYRAHDGIEFTTQLERGALVNIDRDQLTQVLVNLLKNAEEAMTDRVGTISVRLAIGSVVTLSIEDEGPGVAPELRHRLFEPYVTTKPQGSGLGLAIASRIVHEHGGRLLFFPTEVGGARFDVVLPKTRDGE
jgi:two-component system nitrogen regulation sensor histidine kinase NtrY